MSLFGDVAGLAAINTAYNKLGSIGTSAQTKANAIGQDVFNKGAFRPFTVRSALGSSSVNQDGGLGSYLQGQAKTASQNLFGRAIADVTGPTTGADLASDLGYNLVERARSEFDQPIAQYGQMTSAADQALTQGMDFMGQAGMPVGAREQQVFERIRAAQRPEEERRRLELEERLATQGRLGVATNLYGGTPEQLALERAQAEAQNTAMLQAMQQAQAEQAQAGALGQQFTGLGSTLAGQLQNLEAARQGIGMGYAQGGLGLLQGREALQAAELQQSLAALKGALMPEAAQLNLFQQGLNAAKLRETAQQFRTGLFGEAQMTGVDALLASGLGQANLIGNVGSGILAAGAQSSSGGGLFDAISKGIKALSDIRLKKNVEFIGQNDNGFNIYRWDWNDKANELGEYGSSVGVIAQELLADHSSKVHVDSSGYYAVNYTGIWR